MLATSARAPKPGSEKGRLAGRPLSKFINSDSTDNTTAIRLQRLLACGIVGQRANLIASLAWGVPHHG
jgi:hypothetical protein